jgi:hypothetical protein
LEEDLNIFENGRQSQFFSNKTQPHFFENGRQPQGKDYLLMVESSC